MKHLISVFKFVPSTQAAPYTPFMIREKVAMNHRWTMDGVFMKFDQPMGFTESPTWVCLEIIWKLSVSLGPWWNYKLPLSWPKSLSEIHAASGKSDNMAKLIISMKFFDLGKLIQIWSLWILPRLGSQGKTSMDHWIFREDSIHRSSVIHSLFLWS